jgi:hypothetical protein
MADKTAAETMPLTVHLSADLAKRLQAAAAAQKRPAAAVVIDLLERFLPRSQPGEPKKGKIPYT